MRPAAGSGSGSAAVQRHTHSRQVEALALHAKGPASRPRQPGLGPRSFITGHNEGDTQQNRASAGRAMHITPPRRTDPRSGRPGTLGASTRCASPHLAGARCSARRAAARGAAASVAPQFPLPGLLDPNVRAASATRSGKRRGAQGAAHMYTRLSFNHPPTLSPPRGPRRPCSPARQRGRRKKKLVISDGGVLMLWQRLLPLLGLLLRFWSRQFSVAADRRCPRPSAHTLRRVPGIPEAVFSGGPPS